MTQSNADRTVFYGFGAWVGRLHSLTRCAWWPADPNEPSIAFDPGKLIESDLDRNPAAYRAGRIPLDEIEVDDKPSDGGNTKLGPTWPTGSTINSIYLEANRWAALPAPVRPSRTPPGKECHDYELTTVVYWRGRLAPRRFWGVHAEILQVKGTVALTTVWTPGQSLVSSRRPDGTYWLDLSTAHPIEPGFTEIGAAPGDPKTGALFLDEQTMGNQKLDIGKTPWWLGSYSAR